MLNVLEPESERFGASTQPDSPAEESARALADTMGKNVVLPSLEEFRKCKHAEKTNWFDLLFHVRN